MLNIVEPNETITVLSELGIFFMMLHSGLETDPKELFKSSNKAFFIALGGGALPFIGGYLLFKYFGYNTNESLFIGMGLSVTGLAVVIKMFKDLKISFTQFSHTIVGAALINDILALIIFSVILNLFESGEINFTDILFVSLKVFLFFIITVGAGKYFFTHLQKIIYRGNKGFTFTIDNSFSIRLDCSCTRFARDHWSHTLPDFLFTKKSSIQNFFTKSKTEFLLLVIVSLALFSSLTWLSI